MSKKSRHVAELIERFQGAPLAAHYLGYFDCFNSQKYYEAHDVLEDMWLPDRQGPDGSFYKGLIQLAGAFVHVQKDRPVPAAALLRLARANLQKYPAVHRELNVSSVIALINEWEQRLQGATSSRRIFEGINPPLLLLLDGG